MQDPLDFIDRSSSSDCCDAPIVQGGMCSECGEHCEPADEDLVEYCRRDAQATVEAAKILATLPPLSPEWLAANPTRWYRAENGEIVVWK